MSDSSDDEHPYIKYGTPLPELSELTIKPSALKNNVHVFDQIVTDEEGRRRFHGAFTGGFSAGYYNTVGTKEGWKPSTFVSTRASKSERKVYQAEDFMDDEDLGEFGIASKTLSTKSDFTSGRKRNAIEEKKLNIRDEEKTFSFGASLLESLVVPIRKNIGIKILKGMGWKEGQGLGPHVIKRKKNKKKPQVKTIKVYGCQLPGASQGSDSEDENIPKDFKFAPKDMMPISITHKDNTHGIGYSGLNPNAALHKKTKKSTAVKARTKSGSKLSFFGQAFGVGAYEDEDEDIYAQDTMANYDTVLSIEKNPEDTYGWTKPLAITGAQRKEAIGYGDAPKVLFIRAKKQTKLYPKVYPPPLIPPDFDPCRRMKLQRGAKRIKDMNLPKTAQSNLMVPPNNSTNSQVRLNADDRRAMLEDGTESSSKVQSVFDFISFEDRQRMEAAKREALEIGYKGEVMVKEKSPPPQVDRSQPLCDAKSLKPFSNNPEKLRRYEEYERAVRQRKRDPYSTIESNLTEWERKHERDEFSRMSQVYLHLTTNINARFRKGVSDDDDDDDENTVKSGQEETKSAAKMKMFGIMTHDNVDWHPDPLLCKRFNVPDPYPNSDSIGVAKPSFESRFLPILDRSRSKETESTDTVNSTEKDNLKEKTGIISDTKHPPTFSKARPFMKGRWDKEPDFVGPMTRPSVKEEPDISHSKNEDAEKAEIPPERPPMELFKSIFASSEEESSSSEEDDDENNEDIGDKEPAVPEEPIDATKSRISAADVFMKPLPVKHEVPTTTQDNGEVPLREFDVKTETRSPPKESQNKEKDIFGPALPPPKLFQTINLLHKEDSMNNHKSHKKHSKHKKHKKHDHKSKKKKKR